MSIKSTKNTLLAPTVLNKAMSNCFVSTPIVNMLFIIIALKMNKLTMISLSTTPMNIPKYPITIKLLAIGIDDWTENNPIFVVTLEPNELKSS